MSKILYKRNFWFLVIASLIIFSTIIVYKNLDTIISNPLDTLKYAFGIAGILTTLFNYWKRFNLFITRIWIILTNSSAIWNISANFEGSFDESILSSVYKKLREKNEVRDYIQVNNSTFRVTMNGLNYVFEYVDIENEDLTETKGKLLCRITDFNSSYDNSIDIFSENIIPTLRFVENESHATEKMFSFKISFKGKNPFVNLIAKNIDKKKVHSLWYNFKEETKVGRKDIKVTEKSLECTTTDITDFQLSSMNFIALVGD